jgi:hypothetical protein
MDAIRTWGLLDMSWSTPTNERVTDDFLDGATLA